MKSLRNRSLEKLFGTFLKFCEKKHVIIILGRRAGAGASVLRPKNIEYCGLWSLLRCSF